MTTTVTKTIGVGGSANGYDYADFNSAAAAMPTSLVDVDQAWVLEVDSTHGELVFATVQAISGFTVDATRSIKIRPKAGKGIADNVNKLTNPLAYNASKGAAIRSSAGDWAVAFNFPSVALIEGLQLKGTQSGPTTIINIAGGEIRSCIVDASTTAYANGVAVCGTIVNSLLVVRADNGYMRAIVNMSARAENCTLISFASALVCFAHEWNALLANNCTMIGMQDSFTNGGGTGSLTSTKCVATFATLAGTDNVVNAVASSLIVNATSASLDARVKTGGALINAGSRQQAWTLDVDIVNSLRSLTTPTIGAWEYAAPVADTTPPTLTSPTGTAVSSTTASGSISTNESNGTLYYLANGSATATATEVKAASSVAVVSTGVQNVSFTGLTPSTGYYAHYLHRDSAGNDSTVSNSTLFTTAATTDSTPPVLTGSITLSSLTSTSYTMTCPSATDNIGVTGYEYSLNAGANYTSMGLSTVANISGRTPGSTDNVRMRAFDAAGNRSAALSLAVTLAVGTAAKFSTPGMWNGANTLLANTSGWGVNVYNASTGAFVAQITGLSTNSSGVIQDITHASMSSGTQYTYEPFHATYGRRLPVATAQ